MCTRCAPTDFGWRVTDTPNPAQAVSRDNRCCPNKIPFVRSSENTSQRTVMEMDHNRLSLRALQRFWHRFAPHFHRFVSFPSFGFPTHLVSDCHPCCRSSLHFTPLSTFPDVDCSLSNHDSPSRCIAPSICADTTTRVLRSHVTSSFCSTLHHSCPFRSSRLSNGLVWSDAQPQNPIASLLSSTRSGVLVRRLATPTPV